MKNFCESVIQENHKIHMYMCTVVNECMNWYKYFHCIHICIDLHSYNNTPTHILNHQSTKMCDEPRGLKLQKILYKIVQS